MKPFLRLLILSSLPCAALAQASPDAPAAPVAKTTMPIIIVDQGSQLGTAPAPQNARPVPGAGFANFPENAVTRVGENTTGQHIDAPASGAEAPAAPTSPAAAAPPATPASPTPPPSPAAKLWPRDTVRLFMPSCVGFHAQFITPCACVITKLMATIPHDEFLRESDAGTIEGDPRLSKIRTDCASAPQKKE